VQEIQPGSYAIPAEAIASPSSPYFYFASLKPIRVEGYTIRIYRIGPTEIKQITDAVEALIDREEEDHERDHERDEIHE
jgi:hypothetical protein